MLLPPPKLSLSEWADRHFYLSAESAASPGRWRTLPYQKGILDAITDPTVERVSVMKSARVGYTKCINAAIAYFIAQDPCPILVVQPTIEDAEGYSKEEIAPMIRDCEVLTPLVGATPPKRRRPHGTGKARKESTAKSSAETILSKSFPGGVLSMVGANSGRGFRRVSRRVVIFDEVDGYPSSAGSEGDPIKLGTRRAEYYWNRKIIAGSTPLIAGASRMEEMFAEGDRRRFYVPCPHCGHMDFLRFSGRSDDEGHTAGHVMRWPKNNPQAAHFMCPKCGCVIEETSKRSMLEAGEWRAEGEFKGHASFHIWAAYSLSPNATWGQIAVEFIEAKAGGPEKLQTFCNTVLGETWKIRGEAPDWERLFMRRETYKLGTVPPGPVVLTCGVDVQRDRFVFEVVGWAKNKESWSVAAGEIHGDTALDSTWAKLDELLARTFPGEGRELSITLLAIDSGYNTQRVYTWARRYPMSRVIATKGVSGAKALVGAPSPVDVTIRGKRKARGYKVWPVGVDIAKSELYGFLGLPLGDGESPSGYCHFPEHDEDYFQQLTAEHLVPTMNKRTRRVTFAWHVIPNRENHILDARILARVAVSVLGLDQLPAADQVVKHAPAASSSSTTPAAAPAAPPPTPAPAPAAPKREGFLNGGRPRSGWLGRRR